MTYSDVLVSTVRSLSLQSGVNGPATDRLDGKGREEKVSFIKFSAERVVATYSCELGVRRRGLSGVPLDTISRKTLCSSVGGRAADSKRDGQKDARFPLAFSIPYRSKLFKKLCDPFFSPGRC